MQLNRKVIIVLAMAMLFGLSGCSSAATSEPTDLDPQGEVTEIDETLPTVTAIHADGLALVVNGTATENLNATADAEDLIDDAQIVFTYAASNDSITVDAEGNVTALAASAVKPFVTITAQYDADGDGIADSKAALAIKKVQIAVSIDAQGIALSQNEGIIEVYPYTGAASDVIALETTVLPEGASTQVAYSSSDESVAIVSADGTVSGVSAGSATITSTSEEGFEDSCEVTVSRSDQDAQAEADTIAAAEAAAAEAAQKAAEEAAAQAAAAQAAADAAAAQAAADAAAAQAAADAAAAQAATDAAAAQAVTDTAADDAASDAAKQEAADAVAGTGGSLTMDEKYKIDDDYVWSPFS